MCVIKGCDKGTLDYRTTADFTTAMGSLPHIAIVQFGTNDVLNACWDEKAFIADYCDFINNLKALPSRPSIYINIPTPLYFKQNEVVESGEVEEKARIELNKIVVDQVYKVNVILPPIIRKIGVLTDSVVIDLFTAMGGAQRTRTDALSDDSLHLNDLGYLGVAHEIARVISEHEKFDFISAPPRVESR